MTYIGKKRTKALLLATIFCITYLLTYMLYMKPLIAYAATTGTVNGTNVNVRTAPAIDDNIITQLNFPDQVTILDTVNPDGTFAWYNIGFDYNGTYTEGYIAAQYVTLNPTYTEDTDFEAYMNEQGFPESYKLGLRQLHAQYPKWVFIADHVNDKYDWDTVVTAESKTGKSLISGTSAPSWKSTEPDAYNAETGEWYTFDSGNWVAASRALVAYALDPRNFLNSTNIFMFEKLSYNYSLQSESGINSIVSGTFLDNTDVDLTYDYDTYTYAQALIRAAQESGVSPYHLAARIIQEIGSSGDSNSISGNLSGYEGYYNYYNQGAYKNNGLGAIENGLLYAAVDDSSTWRPWNTRMKSIIGGAIIIGKNYITKGQDTLYYEKFDLLSGTYWHQYMTNLLAPRSESITSAKAYSDSMRTSTALVFSIPVYQNMPSGICEIPTDNKSPNNYLSSLSVSGTSLTPTFDYTKTDYDVIVDNNVAEITVSAEPMASTASISGVQTFGLNVGTNTISVVVTAENGETRTYTITVVRQGNANNNLSSLNVSNGSLSPAFASATTSYEVGVENSVSQITVLAETENPTATVENSQTFSLNVGSNTITIPVTAENGDIKNYTITVARAQASQPGGDKGSMSPNSYKVEPASNLISGVTVGSSASDVLSGISFTGTYTGKIVDADNNVNSGKIGTGNHLIVTNGNGNTVYDYTFVVYGDVTGDGVIDIYDLLNIKRHILNTRPLSGAFLAAADANRGSDEPSIYDILSVKRHILKYLSIKQD